MAEAPAPHRLPELPYPKDALAPHLSAESFDYHYGKHHAAYVNKLNQLLDGHEWASLPLAELIPAALERRITESFGDVTTFKQQFTNAGATQFGSGWVWLVETKGRLEVVTTSNADTPITERKRVLIGCDVWEHAYYVDYRNARADFLQTYLEHLVSWEEALRRLQGPEA